MERRIHAESGLEALKKKLEESKALCQTMKSYMHKTTGDMRSNNSALTDITSRLNSSNDIQPLPAFMKALTCFESTGGVAGECQTTGEILNETFSRSSGGTLIEGTNNNRLSEGHKPSKQSKHQKAR